MGYYTQFSLKVRNISESEYERLNEILKDKDLLNYVFCCPNYDAFHFEAEYPSYEDQRWYNSEEDMKTISEFFPNAVFELSGEGEEFGDFWREYFKDGKTEYCCGEIIYETPKEIEWESLLVI